MMDKFDLTNIQISPEVIKKVPIETAKLYNIMPVSFEHNTLTIAIEDPSNVSVIDDLRFSLNCNIKVIAADREAITQAIFKYYQVGREAVKEVVKDIKPKEPKLDNKKLFSKIEIDEDDVPKDAASFNEAARKAPVVKLLDMVLLKAVKDQASDIHLEPFEKDFRIRYRVDGVLSDFAHPPKNLATSLISGLKVMSSMDVAESRVPQDGRILIKVAGKAVDLRVSTLPTAFGESVVIRVLDKSVVSLSLDQVGLTEDIKLKLAEVILKPNGIILTTGPTGSGKTTTLYSCLRQINKPELKVITTEDPVEYDVPGIIQVQIQPKIKLDFALCLRHILRQDPDIIMVGEIRDDETAEMSIQAALTGHLVLSTLHTNDASGAITRLVDMNIEPFLITSTLEAILAQRLVRTICSRCRESYEPTTKEMKQLALTPEEVKGKSFYRGTGCDKCGNSGYKGRTGLFELLIMNDEIRRLIITRRRPGEIREKAQSFGMRTLRDEGLIKIFNGTTTVDEVVRETMHYA